MKDKLTQFIDNTIGNWQEVSYRDALYQCMDLVYEWVFCLGFPKSTIQHLYASQVFTQATDLTRQYFDIIPNSDSFIPQDGDIAVFSNKTLVGGVLTDVGHIGIALSGGTTKSFKCYEQNWPLGTNPSIKDRNYDTPKLLGVLRPKFNDNTINDDEDRALRVLEDAISTLKVRESGEKFGNVEGLTRALIGFYQAPPAPDPRVIELEGQNTQWTQHFEDIKEHLRPVGIVPGDDLPKIIGAIDGLVAKKNEYEDHLKQDKLNTEIPDQSHLGYVFAGKWDVSKYLIEFWKREVK